MYESNGPDVKVRGTAQTVADKYLQLARDAHSAGDTVMAEAYFQHAEHYLRIVAASQPFPQQNAPQRRPGEDYSYDDGEDGDDDQPTPVASGGNGEGHRHYQPQQQPQHQPQHTQVPQQQQQPQLQATDAPAAGAEAGEQPWGGPEPEFLRRGPGNGASRSRRRQPRSANGRSEAAGQDANGSAGDDAVTQDAAGPGTIDQA